MLIAEYEQSQALGRSENFGASALYRFVVVGGSPFQETLALSLNAALSSRRDRHWQCSALYSGRRTFQRLVLANKVAYCRQ